MDSGLGYFSSNEYIEVECIGKDGKKHQARTKKVKNNKRNKEKRENLQEYLSEKYGCKFNE
jgi:hypothetical protein